MRRLFLVCMIVLLPLRAWAGGFMSIDMSFADMPMNASIDGMAADCPMRGASDNPSGDPSERSLPSSVACHSCILCLPFAQPETAAQRGIPLLRHANLLPPDTPFQSAELALSLKPPIF